MSDVRSRCYQLLLKKKNPPDSKGFRLLRAGGAPLYPSSIEPPISVSAPPVPRAIARLAELRAPKENVRMRGR
jgi:hypothetical protein